MILKTLKLNHLLFKYIMVVDYDSLNLLAYEVYTTFLNLRITLGTVESITGGLIGHLITNQDGASSIFGGSIVVYTAAAKNQVLKIPMKFIHQEGTISKKMVERMLLQMKIYPVDVILAISGIAGKEIEGLERGTVFVGVDCLGVVIINKFLFDGTREEIKMKAADASLKMILKSVEHLEKRP